MTFNWTCPYCAMPQVVRNDNFSEEDVFFVSTRISKYGEVGLSSYAITCVNEKCQEVTIKCSLHSVRRISGYGTELDKNALQEWDLKPDSMAKPFPDYIPQPLRESYEEACKIRELSPKASATLSRRCIQGMIRDFCGISKGTLHKEIQELETLLEEGNLPKGVQPEHIEAIDHVRAIGNIGAHFEKDIDLIVDVDPEEAGQLIGLIELLFEEWYITSYQRQMRLEGLKATRDNKDEIKNDNRNKSA